MWLIQDPIRQNQVKRLQASLLTQNQEDRIQRPLARRLYGKRLKASVSRLEQFAKCPFGHYARYGLKLRERSTYQLSSPDIGEFFHALLHDFAIQLQERGLDWGKLTKEESWALVSELAEQLVPNLQHEILLSSARYRYLTHKLKRTVHHAVRVLGEHARRGIFIPIQLEVGFGPSETLPGVDIPLSEDDSLLLCGQIDRVDAAGLDGKVYLRILDYKSRELPLALDSIYYGLNLQLLTYLDVALQGAEVLLNMTSTLPSFAKRDNVFPRKIPAGFLYFPVLEPQLEEKIPLSLEELEQHRVKAVKVGGYLLANPRVLEAMDSSFSTGQSDLLGLKLKKDGTFKKGSNVLTEDQFSLLSDYLHQLFRQTGEEILNGDISLSPYRKGKSTGCLYCSYKPVCHFDPYLPENRYRDLPTLKQEEIWRRLES
jgi:ATP-dependent helicase/nuclease subunit B